jgi:seryl-tRNA synthetase
MQDRLFVQLGFDLEKARASIAHYRIENPSNVDTESALKELVDQANLAEDAIAEIERLRANEKSLSAILDRQVQEQAARIKSLKKEIRRLKHESKVEQEFTNSYIKHLHEAEARIKELEDAHKRSGAKYAKIINELRSSVYANIPGLDVGKIGPDAKPRSWQITEERVGLLEYCLETLLDAPDIEEIPGPGHSIEMLRAMLTEAGQ